MIFTPLLLRYHCVLAKALHLFYFSLWQNQSPQEFSVLADDQAVNINERV